MKALKAMTKAELLEYISTQHTLLEQQQERNEQLKDKVYLLQHELEQAAQTNATLRDTMRTLRTQLKALDKPIQYTDYVDHEASQYIYDLCMAKSYHVGDEDEQDSSEEWKLNQRIESTLGIDKAIRSNSKANGKVCSAAQLYRLITLFSQYENIKLPTDCITVAEASNMIQNIKEQELKHNLTKRAKPYNPDQVLTRYYSKYQDIHLAILNRNK